MSEPTNNPRHVASLQVNPHRSKSFESFESFEDSKESPSFQTSLAHRRPKGVVSVLQNIVAVREERGLLRTLPQRPVSLPQGQDFVDLSSNDYIGLARSEDVYRETELQRDVVRREYAQLATSAGSTGSRLLSGNSPYHEAVEKRLADFHNAPSALLFNSGFDANLGLFGSLPQRGDVVVFDELMHSSVREGLRLCRAETIPFKHNDVDDLRRILDGLTRTDGFTDVSISSPATSSSTYVGSDDKKPFTGNILIAVESVYSMDGHCAPLAEICSVADNFGADIIVDEAHGTGVFGPGGRGLVSACGLENHSAIVCRVHTFGKAVGAHGAVVLGPAVLKSFLLNYARSLVYTTALPADSLSAILASYKVMEESADERQKHVFHLVDVFLQRKQRLMASLTSKQKPQNSETNAIKVLSMLDSPSPIQGLVVKGNARVMQVGKLLQSQGFDVKPIRSPTVPVGTERLRIILHFHNTEEQVHQLMDAVEKCLLNMRAAL